MASSKLTDKGLCADCRGPTTKRCGRCHEVCYCGKECQKKDWSSHKLFCSLAYPAKDPKKRSVRAVLLDPDSTSPKFVEVPYIKLSEELEVSPDNELFLGKGCGYARRMREHYSRADGSVHMITVFCRDNALNEGTKSNKCVETITNGKNGKWKGPLLVFDGETLPPPPADPKYYDLKKEDCSEIVGFFLEERNIEGYGKMEMKMFDSSKFLEMLQSGKSGKDFF